MDELEKLYNVLIQDGKTTKSFEQFKLQYSQDNVYREKVYEVVLRDGFTKKDKATFFATYNPSNTLSAKNTDVKIPVALKEKTQKAITTESPSEDGSLGTQFTKKKKFAFDEAGKPVLQKDNKVIQKLGEQAKGKKFSVTPEESYSNLGTQFFGEAGKSVTDFTKDVLQVGINTLSDKKIKNNKVSLKDMKPIPVSERENVFTGIIKSIPTEKKQKSIENLTKAKDFIESQTKNINNWQAKYPSPEGIATSVTKGIGSFAPDLLALALTEGGSSEIMASKYASMFAKAPKVIAKYAPKAAVFLEEGLKSSLTKLLAVKGAVKGAAENKDNMEEGIVKGGIKGAAEGFYMHGLGAVAGKVAPKVISGITKTGLPSEYAALFAYPATTAGVFAGAKALSTPILEGRTATKEELYNEFATGLALSATSLPKLFKTHKEINKNATDILNTDPIVGLKNVLETDNKTLLKEFDQFADIENLTKARTELKKKILQEGNLKRKAELAKEAVVLQHKIDTNIALSEIISNKDRLVQLFNNTESLTPEQKTKVIDRINDIEETFRAEENKPIEENAIQEQAAGQVPVQSETGVSETLAQGTPESRPEIVTAEQTITNEQAEPQAEVERKKQLENAINSSTENDVIISVGNNVIGRQEAIDELSKINEAVSLKTPEIKDEQTIINPIVEASIPVIKSYDDNSFANIDDKSFEAFESTVTNPDAQKVLVADLKTKVTSGEITLDDAKKQLNNYNNSVGIYRSIPSDLTVGQKKESMGLLKEKKELQNYIDGKDAALVVKQKNRIAEINDELTKIAENKQEVISNIKENESEQQQTTGTIAGNRLFNKSIPAVKEIADRYYGRVFGKKRAEFNGTRKIDKERAKRISDAFIEMKHDPNNPEVKAAYKAMAKETLDQYKDFLDAGYKVEINNKEPYANSEDVIEDLRKNKKIKIFSTESGFGDNKITDTEREENPLLKDSGFKDINGQKLLINDVFRAVHDFFGHAELGNSFGPIGEENAWNVHARMYSDIARKAVTTETRGQNSFVNFSGINEEIDAMRNEARNLREAGDEEGAQRIVSEIYDKGSFAEQKVGLLPQEFYNFDVQDSGDINLNPQGVNIRDTEIPTVSTATQGLSEAELPGYNRMINEVEGIVSKSKNRGVSELKIAENVMNYVMGSKVYETATDVQREALVREVNKRFGIKEKAAPSANRILGKLKDITKITMSEKVALVKQIKDTARGAKEAAKAIKIASQELTKEIKELASSGKITANQAANVLRAFSKTNVLSTTSVSRFTDYMSKIFSDAEYSSKLSEANKLRKEIKGFSKKEEKNANLRDLAQQFVKINPSLVEDINTYNEVASRLEESIKGSTIKGQNVKFAETVNIDETMDFVKKSIKSQETKLREEKIEEIKDLMGVDVSDLTNKQIEELLQKDKKFTGEDEKIVRTTIKKAFDLYSSVVKETINTKEDVFTGEKINITKSQEKVVNEFMNMDLSLLKDKESLDAVDSLLNFLVNQSTAKMSSVIAKYNGIKNAKELANKGIKARPLSKYWSKAFGRTLAEQVTPLPILFEKMFPGFNRSGMVMNKIGITELINKSALSENQSRNIVSNYVEEFYKKKANEQDFNTDYNNVERGLTAFMMRSVMGTTEDIKIDFDKRKNLIEESIIELNKGDEKEQAKSKIYQEAYDKILKDSKNSQDVIDKTDKTNLKAIEFWQKQWADKYEQMYDVSLNIYNTLLEKDLNYTPDKLSKISTDIGVIELNDDDSAFHGNNGSVLVDKTGSLKEIQRLKSLPINNKNGKVSRYVDLSFDKNMSNAIYDAIMDINTAEPIRQINSFLNSPDFRTIISSAEDATLLAGGGNKIGRIKGFINNKRGKNPYSNDELSKSIRQLNKVAAFGVNLALSGVTQPIKQVIPVAINTFINTGGRLNLSSTFNSDKLAFINNSGYGIANRGAQSQVDIETLNNLIEKAATTKGEKAFNYLKKANEFQLKLTLEKPDVYIAKSSWLSYYEQALRKQGKDTKNIDYKTHTLDKEAADYAERMVTRQQNVNDRDLAGNLFTSKDATTQVLTKMLMSFASFRMNQASRVGADLITFQDETSSKEDKKIAAASLAGYAAELATFKIISAGLSILIGSAAIYLMGEDEDEEQYQERVDNTIKGVKTGIFVDVLSPIPLTDFLVQDGGAKLTKGIEELTGAPISIYETPKQEWLRQYGTFGIAADRLNKLWDLGNLAATGTYKDDFGKVKEISNDNSNFLKKLLPFGVLASFGLAPTEVQTVINNSVKFAKKSKKTKAKPKTQDSQLLFDPENGVEYDNKTDLERYNPELYKKNFGEGSEWYESNKEEREAKKKEEKEKQEIKDKTYNYTPESKDEFGSKKFGGTKKKSIKSKGEFGSSKFGAD